MGREEGGGFRMAILESVNTAADMAKEYLSRIN